MQIYEYTEKFKKEIVIIMISILYNTDKRY